MVVWYKTWCCLWLWPSNPLKIRSLQKESKVTKNINTLLSLKLNQIQFSVIKSEYVFEIFTFCKSICLPQFKKIPLTWSGREYCQQKYPTSSHFLKLSLPHISSSPFQSLNLLKIFLVVRCFSFKRHFQFSIFLYCNESGCRQKDQL